MVDWRSGNIPDLSPGWAELLWVRISDARWRPSCGEGKSLCVRPVYGLWCAHSFNKPSPSVRVVSRASRIFPRMRMRVRKWAGEGKEKYQRRYDKLPPTRHAARLLIACLTYHVYCMYCIYMYYGGPYNT